MAKRIVLCADGTGNRGGHTPDSNVFKVYKAVDRSADPRQITFYDNGVGTSTNRYWRGLAGAVGFGFKRNVCDLYRFLARHYEPGDQVFLFGFSRGAATVRAFSGFVAAAGLVDGRRLDPEDLDKRVEEAFKRYRSGKGAPDGSGEGSHGVVPIEFIGVWDTVAALGFPRNFRLPGIGMWVFNSLFGILDRVVDPVFPHRFYNYELTPNVRNAYQALSVDDERASFWPMVWDETACLETVNVEQVWFPGAHSNVGGGLGRVGLAMLCLDWMLVRAAKHGLVLHDSAVAEARSQANALGRLVDSRDGPKIFFRYTPRDIELLSEGKLRGPIRIHRSVIERMKAQVAEYAPGWLPHPFAVVDTALESDATPGTAGATEEEWRALGRPVRRATFGRKCLYVVLLEAVLFMVGAAIWLRGPTGEVPEVAASFAWLGWLLSPLAGLLKGPLPSMFDNAIHLALLERPIYFIATVGLFVLLWMLRSRFRKREARARQVQRMTLLSSVNA